MKKLFVFVLFIFAAILLLTFFFNPFSAPGESNEIEILTLDSKKHNVAALKLEEKGFIKSMIAFEIAINIKGKNNKIEPGGYYLSRNMDTWKVIAALTNGPDLKWVTVAEGMRKEQIGEKLQSILGWSNEELEKWNNVYTTQKSNYIEGVYFPDTYLIPVDENGQLVAARMINNFNEKFRDYYDKFSDKNIKWTTALKIASLIQREAGGSRDMPLISGVMWNRLNNNQKLDIDATVQYAKGETNGNWWPPVSGSNIRNIDSPYNTYKYPGLPPHPISNPGLAAIDAVLNPEETDCIFYLHDRSREIHCSVTYEEHLKNIDKYLN